MHRGQLFRKYFLLILALVCGALIISGGIGLYFAYQENKEALASLQKEKAAGAAARIEQFVSQIEQQLAFAALPQLGAEGLEQRRIEFLKLLRVVPAVTDIAQIDAKGREQLAVSRLKMDTAGANEDRSQEPAFKNARPGRTWFGPVYFRKETEPYMSIAVRSGGESGPVTVAEVNLKFIWDVVTRIKIGQKGKAYVVDSSGHLVADPDIGLVLRKTDLSQLEQVKAAFAPGADESEALLANDLAGKPVLTAYAPIEPAREQAARGAPGSPLGWKVFVEQPVAEVYAALDATIYRTVALLLAGLLFSALAALWLARNMVRPIGVLQEGAQRIGAGDLDQKIDIRTGDELEALAGQFNRMTEQLRESYADLERKVEERTAELKQALEFQSASGEILSSISSSIANTQPVFDAICTNLLRLFGTQFAVVRLLKDDQLELAAFKGEPGFEKIREHLVPFDDKGTYGQAILTRQVVQYAPIKNNPAVPERARKQALTFGYDAVIAAPMIRGTKVIGAIATSRREPRVFDEKQVALLKAFADQAVIAIENARLVNETKESLEQQTATSEILKVISSSPTDVQPVLDAIVQSAARLFAPCNVAIAMRDGDLIQRKAFAGPRSVDKDQVSSVYPLPFDPNRSLVARSMIERRVIEIPDTEAAGLPEVTARIGRAAGYRSLTIVPLVREGEGVGAIGLNHPQPGFKLTEKQLALVRTFADQAVIAIENVRLFNETKESLEQQTATAEILRVISSSPNDVQPVFETIVRKSVTLCEAVWAAIWRYDGRLQHFVATSDGFPPAAVERLRSAYPSAPREDATSGRAILKREVVTIPDVLGDTPYNRELGTIGGWRRQMGVPMLLHGEPLGVIVIGWKEAGPARPKDEALLRTFADQAVIAIENVRLFNETKESLEQQTATSEILKVISSSTTDTQPVFEAIVESGLKLFPDAAVAVTLPQDGQVHLAAIADLDREHAAEWQKRFPFPLTRDYMHSVAVLDRRMVDVPDAQTHDDPSLAVGIQNFLAGGYRAVTIMPMLRGEAAIGTVSVLRRTPGPLTEKQVALLRTFADQAVIAIENVRLFNETKESLEQQTAISEILRVISSSPADVGPVLEAVAERAARICGAPFSDVILAHGSTVRVAAAIGDLGRPLEPVVLDRSTVMGRSIVDRTTIQVADLQNAGDEYPLGSELARKYGHRTILAVPLARGGRALGTILLRRAEVRPFEAKHVALLKTFADQAAIAIENARLFNETKESLEQQTATSEILRVISDSPGDVKPILGAVADRAARLCEATSAAIYVLEGESMRRAAFSGPDELIGRKRVPYSAGTLIGRAIVDCQAIHVHDIESARTEYPLSWEFAQQYGRHQTMLAVPLMREGRPFGTMLLRRTEIRPFTEKQIRLSRTFADQAAIGIENVRLFNETKEALEQQKASAEVLGAISSSIADTKPVFDKILESCQRLFEGNLVGVTLVTSNGMVELAAYEGEHKAETAAMYPMPLSRESGTGCAILDGQVAHFPDVKEGMAPPRVVKGAQTTGFQSIIFAPMLFEGRGIGAIWVARPAAGPFTDKQITLLKTFADQAVIAIQNARLFREIQEKGAQLEIANKHKSEFLANMSHELRTPLNAIIGFSEVLSERMFGELNEKQADYLKDIHESGKHLLSLINDILDLSKIEAGRMELEVSTFDLPSALSNAMTLVRERAQRHGIELSLDVDRRLGAFEADERKFKQIVVNLLSNAVKFTPDGGRVDVSAKKYDGSVEVAVRDTGIGIAPEDHEAVFEEFKQVGRDYTRKAEGTGLGLALTKRFVELHGGRISLQSAPGKGSTFTIKLPVRQ